ncbi:hypothetical protein L484_004203 [Morus notabilis]|uniref:F-box protein n=1 Tax=Morus notabilis TaxID=981085 RepID=W9RU01_9ROSA|nr:hypothetical protein L484_004203 [Morus notabilis]
MMVAMIPFIVSLNFTTSHLLRVDSVVGNTGRRIFQLPLVIAEAYSLSEDSWRQINIPHHIANEINITSQDDYLHWKGFCYWGLTEDYKSDLRILCGKGDWTLSKHLLVGPLVGVGYPLTFWNSDVFLMKDEDDKLLSVNFRANKLRKIGADGTVHLPICFYIKSLVSVVGRGSPATRRVQAQGRRAKRKKTRLRK